MSRGNIDNNSSGPTLVDRLNARLARLMGKKDQHKFNKPSVPSNKQFLIILIIMVVFLWLLTGFYYIPDNNYGLILKRGKIDKVENGLQIGFTLPYPFAEVVLIDASNSNITIGKQGNNEYNPVVTSDNRRLVMAAEISYRINDPRKFFLTFYQDDMNLDQRVNYLAMAITQDYMLHQQSTNLLKSSTIVTSNDIRRLSNTILEKYGIELTKYAINILSVNNQQIQLSQKLSSSDSNLANKLLEEANQYSQAKSAETQQITQEFKQYLTQSHSSKDAVSELMYYKMLSSIPRESGIESYPLLSKSLASLKSLVNDTLIESGSISKIDLNDVRAVNRNVDRERIFKDR